MQQLTIARRETTQLYSVPLTQAIHIRCLSLLVASMAVFLSASQTYTAVKAPSAKPVTPAARRLARTHPLAERRRQELGDRSPFHPVERVVR